MASSSLNPEVVDDPVLGDGGRLRLAQPPLQVLGELLGVAQLDLVVVDAPRHILDGQQRLLQLLGQGQGRICSIMVEWCFHVLTIQGGQSASGKKYVDMKFKVP